MVRLSGLLFELNDDTDSSIGVNVIEILGNLWMLGEGQTRQQKRSNQVISPLHVSSLRQQPRTLYLQQRGQSAESS